ncbi:MULTISPECIES: co-chaperone HscB [Shewanella]|uniref:Co-chaperone protein HscB homolog n=1 Tax=Shewanella indica TaxID=768528 RepID=A0ABU4QIV5_9GAMM|nr:MULTISPECIES: co-chaperone HscB [Shewanella]OIN14222.1 co-chaperone HscB [Shewanella algae]MCE9792995.1 co-chaperone HscB [Shewanella indica]MCE9851936.1 co-chaperone HscB [Shewanella chilikensis]MDX6018440.1 co-chaperone HscB [Shewanella indica]NDO74383.1 co-chaperone HscB [Shewanella sp. SE1]
MNYFELFDLTPSFDVDTAELASRYRDLQRAVHPDKFANASEQQKLLAISRTAQINDAFQTLKDPIRRAEHMLALKGVDISHETTTVKDTAFLMQQMEWREALEEIGQGADAQSDIDELDASFAAYRKQVTELLRNQLHSSTEADAIAAADQVRKLKFMAKLQDELQRAQDALFD